MAVFAYLVENCCKDDFESRKKLLLNKYKGVLFKSEFVTEDCSQKRLLAISELAEKGDVILLLSIETSFCNFSTMCKFFINTIENDCEVRFLNQNNSLLQIDASCKDVLLPVLKAVPFFKNSFSIAECLNYNENKLENNTLDTSCVENSTCASCDTK